MKSSWQFQGREEQANIDKVKHGIPIELYFIISVFITCPYSLF